MFINIFSKKVAELVLAFDIEHSGIETIGVGASVVDTTFKQLDSFFIGIYDPVETKFSERCWNTFWSKNKEVLNILQYKGTSMEKEEREKDMIKYKT